jgi:hypothetical protein
MNPITYLLENARYVPCDMDNFHTDVDVVSVLTELNIISSNSSCAYSNIRDTKCPKDITDNRQKTNF